MKIILTDHGRERLIERVGCRKEKAQRVAAKAWNMGVVPDPRFTIAREKAGYTGFIHCLFQGCVLVFQQKGKKDTYALVTCLEYNKGFKKKALPQDASPTYADLPTIKNSGLLEPKNTAGEGVGGVPGEEKKGVPVIK